MQENAPSNDNTRVHYHEDDPMWWKPSWTVVLCITLALSIVALFIACRYWIGYPNDTPVFISGVIGMLTLSAIIVQVAINRHQWKAMQDELKIAQQQVDIAKQARSPSLRVNVSAENFQPKQTPIFFVRITNQGASDAKNVAIMLRALISGGHQVAWGREQTVTIPANDERRYPLHWNVPMTNDEIRAFNRGEAKIEVSGYYKVGDSDTTEFCFRYYPWRGERPSGLDQFFPCDFDQGRALALVIQPAELTLTPGTVNLTYSSQTTTAEE